MAQLSAMNNEKIDVHNGSTIGEDQKLSKNYNTEIVWRNVSAMLVLHALALYAIKGTLTGEGKLQTFLWFYLITFFGSLGVQAGSHRLWAHKCYKAKLPLRVVLAILQTLALQNDILEWSRDHRVHHKYSETDADPHNAKRGFFFCHMGWLLCKKHPDVKEKGKTVDMSDLLADPVVRFQCNFYIPLVLIFWGLIPTAVPMYFFNEKLLVSVCGNALRYVLSLHLTWTVNSVAHLYGMRPYDKTINPRDSPLVIYWGMGEGYHNYHHVFPYDYSASEFGWQLNWNPATAFIDLCAWLGLAYDLKVAANDVIKQRISRTGSHNDKYDETEKMQYYWTDFLLGLSATTFPLIAMLGLRAIIIEKLI